MCASDVGGDCADGDGDGEKDDDNADGGGGDGLRAGEEGAMIMSSVFATPTISNISS